MLMKSDKMLLLTCNEGRIYLQRLYINIILHYVDIRYFFINKVLDRNRLLHTLKELQCLSALLEVCHHCFVMTFCQTQHSGSCRAATLYLVTVEGDICQWLLAPRKIKTCSFLCRMFSCQANRLLSPFAQVDPTGEEV